MTLQEIARQAARDEAMRHSKDPILYGEAEQRIADAVTLAVLQEVERRVEGRSMLHSHIGPLHEIGWNGAIANVCSLLSELMRQAGEVEK